MRLKKASAYAVFATVHVAKHQQGGPVQGRAIAEAYGIPVQYLLKILQQLVRSEVLASETGRRGGFMLRRSPGQTTLLEILEAIDGPIKGELTVRKEVDVADALQEELEGICRKIADGTRSVLRGTTIRDLLASY